MKTVLLSMLLVFAFPARGENRHLELAMEFDRVSSSQDKEELVDRSVMPMVLQNFPSLREHRDKLREELLKTIQSDEFMEAKADVYVRIFTERELEQLIEWFRHPAYKLFNTRRFEVNEKLFEYSLPIYLGIGERLAESL
ncbi:MAG: hypothetical protein AAF358_19770 [Pseudomonadota bacterium]